MAIRTLKMDTTNVGMLAVTQLASLSAADVASINQAIVNDAAIFPQNPNTNNVTTQVGTFVTGTTTTTLSSMTSVALGSGPPLTSSMIGSHLNGPGIPGGTVITSVSGSGSNFTLGLNQAPVSGQVGKNFLITQSALPGCYSQNGWLTIPGRGQLKVLPGDVVAVDALTGWPILLSYAAVNNPQSTWVLT